MLSNLIRMILKKKKVRPWACSLKRELELEYVMLLKKKRIRMFMLCIRPNGPLITFNLCQIWTHMERDPHGAGPSVQPLLTR